MAAHQPDAKDLTVLSAGQPRANLIAELGPPVSTQVDKGVRTDIFSFTQGYSGGAKAGRAVLHGAADIATLGLWEAVGTPTEGYFKGSQLSAEVTYDEHDRVTRVVPLKGSEEIQAVMTKANTQGDRIETSSTH
ncbi:hypothetical protein [Hyphomicrobium sp.]|jgi:hypothetical protein|uniref:hypothetical protein n=1 Tax=Hyphomicrobium sp. TaxID=82 RepID=UPI0035671E2F